MNCDPTDVKFTPNASANQDGGFGLYQLTWFDVPARVPNAQELWDWKENVASGTGWLSYLQSNSDIYMWGERLSAGIPMFVPEHVAGNVTFSDFSDTTIEYAVALKRYNGLGGIEMKQYCEFDVDLNEWKFYVWAIYYNSQGVLDSNWYVRDVCLQVP